MASVQDLVEARKAALDAGNKAAGRDLYHRISALGVSPADIDADTIPADQLDLAEPTSGPKENAAASSPPESAVAE